MPKFAVILLAAGKSSRFRDPHYKKPFAPLEDKAVWLYSAEKFLARDDVKQLMMVVAPDDREWFVDKYSANLMILGIQVASGGEQRMDSVAKALEHVSDECDFVAIHDAARPCLAAEWIDQVFAAGVRHGAAMLATPVTSTLKRVRDQQVQETVSRQDLWAAQTPQVFRRELIERAYAGRGSDVATDDAELVERTGERVAVVPGSPINLKITTRDDLRLARYLIKALPKPKLTGPSHPFADDDMWR